MQSKVGVTKDIYESSFINGWKDATSKIANWQTLDVSASLAEVMARKDTDELVRIISKAGRGVSHANRIIIVSRVV